jgi:hypothetical protein
VLVKKHRIMPAFNIEAKGHDVAKVNWLLHGLMVKGYLRLKVFLIHLYY